MSVANERGKLPPDEIYERYKNDSDFHEYVDKYCHDRAVGIFEALAHITVHKVAEYYTDSKKDLINGRADNKTVGDSRTPDGA